jgi:uncharacterized protein (TIGR03085 family)
MSYLTGKCSPTFPALPSHPAECATAVHTHDNVSTITSVTAFAKLERRQLADLLENLGPDVPTLCAGWTTRDLAAHLVVRERRPDASIAQLIPPLRAHGEHVRLAKAAQPYTEILHEVRTPPAWSPVSNRLVDELTNTGEFYIHHEDARRGTPGWEPRDLDPREELALWKATKLAGRFGLRRLGVPVTVRAVGFDAFTVGTDPRVTITGTRVELSGPDDAVERVRTAGLGL